MPGRKRILVVEDEKEIRDVIRETLKDYNVQEAKNAEQGFALAKANPPDLLISDLRLPGMNGLEMVSQLRKDDIFCAVIFISGFADSIKKEEAAQLGAFDFLEKPVSMKKLHSAVKNAFLMGSKVIATISNTGEDRTYADTREHIDLTLRAVPAALVNRLHAYCANRELSIEKTLLDWIQDKLDKS